MAPCPFPVALLALTACLMAGSVELPRFGSLLPKSAWALPTREDTDGPPVLERLAKTPSPDAAASPPAAGSTPRERALRAARLVLLREVRRCLGHPYVWGAAGPSSFDCSGLVLWLYGRVGVRLPRLAVEQGRVGTRVRDRLRLGDLLLFKRDGPGWHVGLYLARGAFVHAAGRGQGVVISSLREPRYRRMFRDARRLMPWEGA